MAYDQNLAARVRDVVASEDGLSEQRMFGGPGFLIHGAMAVAVMGGREMRGWLLVDTAAKKK
ncbi:TfoX/Sxy family protein [Amycolatopsis endophytica]|uniref:TfoX N-terminal domain-containing protein n=1 Tax=Amycolatopsis endophytica TaxID=860233 RepID=A0A853B9I4_9PSEU|nr:hypothetical protein [Amycolatopsis endophytica]NYI91397.1 hypothetical protein [Amycolatopsis endophytica]